MVVYLKFFAGLEAYLPTTERPYPADVAAGTTITEVLRVYGVPADKPRILLVNGRHTDANHVLQDEDTLAVFPPVAGG